MLNRTNNDRHRIPHAGKPCRSRVCLCIKNTLQMLDLGGVGVILIGEFFYTFAPFGAGGGKKDSENSGEKYV